MNKIPQVSHLLHLIIFFIWAISVVLGASSTPHLPLGIHYLDKLIHFIYYIPGGYFSFLYVKIFGKSSSLLSMFFVLCIAFTDEFVQSFVPGRNVDTFDFFADMLGAVVGIALANYREKISK